jgi:hypothetical protein
MVQLQSVKSNKPDAKTLQCTDQESHAPVLLVIVPMLDVIVRVG